MYCYHNIGAIILPCIYVVHSSTRIEIETANARSIRSCVLILKRGIDEEVGSKTTEENSERENTRGYILRKLLRKRFAPLALDEYLKVIIAPIVQNRFLGSCRRVLLSLDTLSRALNIIRRTCIVFTMKQNS